LSKDKDYSKAEHNENAAIFMRDSGKFPDWSVTIAFYSALHYVRTSIFPIGQYQNFDMWYKTNSNKLSKHEALAKLCTARYREVSSKYRALLNSCHKSRYNNHVTQEDEVKKAFENLDAIKKACFKFTTPS